MIAITAENTKRLMTPAAPKPQTWDKRDRAVKAAVAMLGPHAINDVHFTVWKCDGRWMWRSTSVDEQKSAMEKPANLKANGGKKSLLDQAVAIEARGGTASKELLAKAFDEVTGKLPLTTKPATVKDAISAAVDAGLTPKQFRKVAENVADKLAGEAIQAAAVAKLMEKPKIDTTEDENGTPAFLKRKQDTPEQRDERITRMKKSIGPDRKIKNPPNVKDAKKRADKEKSRGVGHVAREAILAGKTNEEALAEVMKVFPKCGSNIGCMSWYRNDLRKKGLLARADGTMAKPAAKKAAARPTKGKKAA